MRKVGDAVASEGTGGVREEVDGIGKPATVD